MSSFLRKRYEIESSFIPKPIETRRWQGDNRVLIEDGGNEWIIVDEDEIHYFVLNPHLRLKSKMLKKNFPNTYPRKDNYTLKDSYVYGVKWVEKTYNLKETKEEI